MKSFFEKNDKTYLFPETERVIALVECRIPTFSLHFTFLFWYKQSISIQDIILFVVEFKNLEWGRVWHKLQNQNSI